MTNHQLTAGPVQVVDWVSVKNPSTALVLVIGITRCFSLRGIVKFGLSSMPRPIHGSKQLHDIQTISGELKVD